MKSSLDYLLNVLGKDRYKILFLSLLVCLSSLSGVAYALLYRDLADSAIAGHFEDLRKILLIFALVLLVQSILNALIRRLQELSIVDLENKLKKALLSDAFYRDYGFVSDVHSGEWMNRFSNDIGIIARNAVQLLPNVSRIILQILASLIVLFKLVPGMTVTLLTLVGCALVFEFFFYRQIKKLHKTVQEKDGLLRIFLQESLSSLAVIKSYGKEERLLSDMDSYLLEYRAARDKRNLFSLVMNFFFGAGVNGVMIFAGVYCAYQIMEGKISYGTFVAVLQIITMVRSPIAGAYGNIPSFYAMIGSLERIIEIRSESLDEKGEAKDFEKIEADGVFFEYHDDEKKKKVIEDLSFTINKGAFIGISGPSGCGKSTLLKLLLSLYRPLKGEILVDGKRLDSSYRSLFAYIPQENLLMKGSIKEVVCFGREYDKVKFDEALRMSCCDEFVDDIDMPLKEKGGGLSEGQMQRIAIARALYSDRPILLLDEATSALNEELELKIMENLKKMKDKTIVFVTHRKSALSYADKILQCTEEEGAYRWMTAQ